MVESSKRVKPWRRQIAAAYADHNFGDMLDGPVSVIIDFYLPRPGQAEADLVIAELNARGTPA